MPKQQLKTAPQKTGPKKPPANKQPAVKVVKLSTLVADPKNARTHGDKNKAAIKRSFKAFGAGRSAVIDGDGVIRAGNGAVEAALAAGIEDAVVIETDGKQMVVVKRPDWTPDEATAYAIADNQTGLLSDWNVPILKDQLHQLADIPFEATNLALMSGFDSVDLAAMFKDETPKPEDAEKPKMGRPISVTKEQREIADQAFAKFRTIHGEDLSDGRICELIFADWLSGTGVLG